MSVKLIKHLKGKLVQVTVDGMLMSGILMDYDKDFYYLGDEHGKVQIAVPTSPRPLIVTSEVKLTDDLGDVVREMIEEKKNNKDH